MNYLFSFLLFSHGLIHLMGFANGFGFSKLPALTKYISKPTGYFLLVAWKNLKPIDIIPTTTDLHSKNGRLLA